MNSPLMLNGHTSEPDHRDRIIASLEQEIRSLKIELGDARQDAEDARRSAERAVASLRKQLTPVYRAFQMLFGEMDAVAPESDHSPAPMNDKKQAMWERWKQKLPGKRAEFIQALLDHGEMTAAQLKVATHSGTSTVPQIIHQLNSVGLIQKNGNKYSLKEL